MMDNERTMNGRGRQSLLHSRACTDSGESAQSARFVISAPEARRAFGTLLLRSCAARPWFDHQSLSSADPSTLPSPATEHSGLARPATAEDETSTGETDAAPAWAGRPAARARSRGGEQLIVAFARRGPRAWRLRVKSRALGSGAYKAGGCARGFHCWRGGGRCSKKARTFARAADSGLRDSAAVGRTAPIAHRRPSPSVIRRSRVPSNPVRVTSIVSLFLRQSS